MENIEENQSNNEELESGLANENDLKSMIADFSNEVVLTPEILEMRRERICKLQNAMVKTPGSKGMKEINEGNIRHFFASGVYGRELFIPAGNLIVSKIHRGKTFNVIAKGCISVICPHNGYNMYTAPHVFVSEPYTKRVVIAHEDTLWITSHGTNKTNLEEVEEEIIAKDFSETKLIKEVL